jgi:hypothetical protein
MTPEESLPRRETIQKINAILRTVDPKNERR